jgi:hypothetical protein
VMKRDKGIMSLSKGDILTSNRIRHFAPWRKSFGPIVDDYYRWESEAWSQEKKMSKVKAEIQTSKAMLRRRFQFEFQIPSFFLFLGQKQTLTF